MRVGKVPWSRKEMIEKLYEFSNLYKQRPIEVNKGGMRSSHMFQAWFALKKLNPKVIIESGVWYGQGTWFFENACPNAELFCIDINLNRIRYRSDKAKYFYSDFSTIDWSTLPKDETVLFCDDHQNSYERVKTAKWFGFKHLIIEDNYPPYVGDCYSLKKAFLNVGFKYNPSRPKSIKARIKRKIEKHIGITRYSEIPANNVDSTYLEQNLDVYYEFSPIFKSKHTRFGALWDDDNFPTNEPLLNLQEEEYQRIFFDEAGYYNWMCYVKLK